MKQQQRGMTIWGWLFVLGTIGFVALITMTLLPIYMENMSVKKAMVNTANESGAFSSLDKAWYSLSKQFYIDQVKSVTKEDIAFETDDSGSRELVISYEVRKSLMFNVDVVVWFEERIKAKE